MGDGMSSVASGLVQRVASRRLLWALEEDGESMKEFVAHGEGSGNGSSSEGAEVMCVASGTVRMNRGDGHGLILICHVVQRADSSSNSMK